MANNPYANKVIYGNQTIMDLSQDTVVASDVLQGKTFHDATGALLTGTYTPSASGYTIHIFTEDSNLFGNTITISKDDVVIGTTTFDNTGNATFDVQQKGTYVASTTYQGTVYQKAVNVTDEFLVELSEVLDGKTALPTDDIQIWLKCAGINDKSYTTLAEVLADTDTLATLMASENAVDYLVRSTTWAVAQALIPVMTSDTTPSGICSSSGIYGDYQPFKAFDGNNATFWHSTKSSSSSYQPWIKYDFGSAVSIKAFTLYAQHNNTLRFKTILVEGSNDDAIYTSLYTETTTATEKENWQGTFAEANYRYVRITFKDLVNVNNEYMAWVNTIQFYSSEITLGICQSSNAMSYIGLNNYCANTLLADSTWCNAICNSEYFESVLNVKVPVMTSNTTPSGECSASSILNDSTPAWKAFDGDDSTLWHSASGMPQWLKYDFGSQKKIYFVKWYNYSQSGGPIASKIQGSNDDSTWTDLVSLPATTTAYTWANGVITEASAYRYYRFYVTETSYLTYTFAAILQFYGREDVVEPEPSTEVVLYEDGTQYIELSNKMSGITNSAVFQSGYIQCSYYSTNASGFSSVDSIDIEGYKSLKVRFKLANNDSYIKVLAADLETNFLNKGINSVKLGFGYRGNVATLYLKDAQYSVTTSDYWASTVSGGNNYIAIDKIWLE